MDKESSEKKIELALSHVHSGRIRAHERKSKRLTFHLTDQEFDEIRETANGLNMSISDYFCALHHYAYTRLDIPKKDVDWVHKKSHSSHQTLDE